MQWYLAVLKKYAEFNGRARRTEYWMFALFNIIAVVILEILAFALPKGLGLIFLILLVVYALAILVPGIAVVVRRLHDQGKPGVWFLIGFIPFIGGIWLLVLMCLPGTVGPNMYGPDPKDPNALQYAQPGYGQPMPYQQPGYPQPGQGYPQPGQQYQQPPQ